MVKCLWEMTSYYYSKQAELLIVYLSGQPTLYIAEVYKWSWYYLILKLWRVLNLILLSADLTKFNRHVCVLSYLSVIMKDILFFPLFLTALSLSLSFISVALSCTSSCYPWDLVLR